MIRIGREALRCLLARRGVTFQRTKTWKESPDPEREATLDRIEHVLDRFPDRVFAFDEFGPLGIRPTMGSGWARVGHPERHPATYHRTNGVRYFHGCYSIGDDKLWGVNRRKKGAVNAFAAVRSIRAARPDGAPIYAILDNLSARKGQSIQPRIHPDFRTQVIDAHQRAKPPTDSSILIFLETTEGSMVIRC